MIVDSIWSLIFFVIGAGTGLSFLSIEKLRKLRHKYIKTHGEKENETTPYDRLDKNTLEKLATKLSSSFMILITVYGVLLAFVVSGKIALALSNLYFVVWCGWTIAIVVRSGIISIKLFDITEIEDQKSVPHTIHIYKDLFSNVLYLLVLTIAVMPIFYYAEIPPIEELKKLPWSFETTLISGVIAVVGSSSLFYFTVLRNNSVTRQFQGIYGFAISFIAAGLYTYTSMSPIKPAEIMFLGISYQIPLIIQFLMTVGYFFGALMIAYLGTALWMPIPRK